MGALMWSLLATLAAALTQAEPIKSQSEVQSVKSKQETSVFTNTDNHHIIIDQNLAAAEETEIKHHGEPMGLFTDHGHQQVEDPAQRTIVKREAKKPENTKRRKKFSKKKMQQQKDKSESKTESDKSKSKSESKTEESEEDSETPESDSSDTSSLSSDESVDWRKYTSDSEKTSESSEKSSKSKKKKKKSSKSDSSSSTTEEVSLTSEEETEEINSGPDSSSIDSSDSTDESSASRHIRGGSSEISYTMSSSASVYSSSEETSEESEDSEDDKSKDGKKKDESSSKSKEKLNSVEPKVTTKVTNKKGKKVTEVKVKFNKQQNIKGKQVDVRMKDNSKENVEKINKVLKTDAKLDKTKLTKDHRSSGNAAGVSKFPQSLAATTQRVLRMVEHGVKSHQIAEHIHMEQDKPHMEMMKVKEAVDKSQKVTDLEHDLNRDYPENGTVEIINWEGTFAPIHGEPYVAPLHHQPDSFWDGIYRSTDPDLPTPPGADVSVAQTTGHPLLKTLDSAIDIVMKNKDKKKGDQKKPKLSIKEKKQKKKEKQEKKANMSGSVDIKASASRNTANIQIKHDVKAHDSARVALHNVAGKGEVHAGLTPHNTFHAAGKSEENLKTPSEEERESGTTYKPEGAYEYPSFRHPDFNPDTAYDENGIPIHESPGWTPPPTLPGDNRFGKDRSRAGAALASRVQAHGLFTLAKPEFSQPHNHNIEQMQDMHKTLAAQEQQHLAEALTAVQIEPAPNPDDMNMKTKDRAKKEKKKPKLTIKEKKKKKKEKKEEKANSRSLANVPGHESIPVILPALHQGVAIKDTIINHKIQKRSASQSGSKELVDNKLEGKRQRAPAKDYKAYRLTDAELLDKEKSAPLEAINPDLYMHRNMLRARRKHRKIPLDKIPNSAEVIAVLVSPQGKEIPLGSIRRIPLTQKPIVYNKDNEAHNPLLYKHRNMFKVNDIKDDGMKISKDVIKQASLNNPQERSKTKAVRLEDFINGHHTLRGRGRENFNPIFINQNKLFNVRTNKFKPVSVENNIAKREVKESLNPFLYSYKNIFSNNPKQILPLKNNRVRTKQERVPAYGLKSSVGTKQDQVPPLGLQLSVAKEEVAPRNIPQRIFGGGVPVIDADSEEAALNPKVKQMRKNNEAMNPYLINYPNMFAVNKQNIPQQTKDQNIDGNVNGADQNNMAKPSQSLDPTVMKYVGRNKENLNPYLYKYKNMFTVDSKRPPKETFGMKNALHKVQLEKGGINPLLFANQKVVRRPYKKDEGHKIKKREA